MKYRWVLRPVEQRDAVAALQQALNDLPEALARALVLRGVETFEQARDFFRPSLEDLHDPFWMRDMEPAAERVAEAILHRERVLVYGDYDVDGTTATALLTRFLRARGAEASFFIPDRFLHGYGLSRAGIDVAAELGAGLIIAVDCGITAYDEARYARERGIDLVICDHHTAGSDVPEALAVLDPKRPDCAYPFKELSGCGVAFKLVQATLARLGEPPEGALSYLDLVALSTASDIVPLYGENRVLMRAGLERLRHPRPGLRALAHHAGLDLRQVTTSRIVFALGPRINAAGRVGDARRAVDLMLAEDEDEAAALAQQLEEDNQQRRAIDRETMRAAEQRAARQLSARSGCTIVLHEADWHLGVLGIVASRLVERFYRPTIMLCSVDGLVKGSARSVAELNIYDALTACADLLSGYGGHDHAAGLSLPEENLARFQRRFDEVVSRQVRAEMLLPAIEIDAPLCLSEVDGRFWAVLKQFAPHGPENLAPVFHARDLEVLGRPRTVGQGGAHLKFRVRQVQKPGRAGIDVIGFGLGEHLPALHQSQREGRPLDLLFSVEENHWQGATTLQLRARDLKLSEVR